MKCYKCKQEKDLTEFYKDKNSKSGLMSKCKSCSIAYGKEYSARFPHWRRESQKASRLRAAWNYIRKNPGKVRARKKVQEAVKIGRIIKPLNCEKCTETRIHAHHYLGYEGDHWKDIQWFCYKHHNEAHRLMEATSK